MHLFQSFFALGLNPNIWKTGGAPLALPILFKSLISEPTLIAWKRYSQPYFQVVATFEEIAQDQTTLVFKMLFETVELCQKIKPHVLDKNEENFDKLELELIRML